MRCQEKVLGLQDYINTILNLSTRNDVQVDFSMKRLNRVVFHRERPGKVTVIPFFDSFPRYDIMKSKINIIGLLT